MSSKWVIFISGIISKVSFSFSSLVLCKTSRRIVLIFFQSFLNASSEGYVTLSCIPLLLSNSSCAACCCSMPKALAISNRSCTMLPVSQAIWFALVPKRVCASSSEIPSNALSRNFVYISCSTMIENIRVLAGLVVMVVGLMISQS